MSPPGWSTVVGLKLLALILVFGTAGLQLAYLVTRPGNSLPSGDDYPTRVVEPIRAGESLGAIMVASVAEDGSTRPSILADLLHGPTLVYVFSPSCAPSQRYSRMWGRGTRVLTPSGPLPVLWLSLSPDATGAQAFFRESQVTAAPVVLLDPHFLLRATGLFVPQVWLLDASGRVSQVVPPRLDFLGLTFEQGDPKVERWFQ